MTMINVMLVCIAIGLSIVPSIPGQTSRRKCDSHCRSTCLILNSAEGVRANSSDTPSVTVTTSPTCIRGPPGGRGPAGGTGPVGPMGPVGIPGYPGETGGVAAVDYKRVDRMVADKVRSMLSRTWPQTGCHDVHRGLEKIQNKTGGVFDIYPSFAMDGTEVYCDLETDGKAWTVFQRRMDGSVNFNRTWEEYVNGFGSPDKEFWMGLEKLHLLTKYRNLILRIDMEDWDGNKRYAEYKSFTVAGKYDKYRVRIRTYSGNAGSSMTYNGRFSTYDQDNDETWNSCSEHRSNSGWWFTSCGSANLNGPYSNTPDVDAWKGVIWRSWRGSGYSLKFVEMKFRSAGSW